MGYSLRDRLGLWLQEVRLLRPLVLRYDGAAPSGSRYVNRINGYLVVIADDGSHR